jgi:aspartate racemase
MSDLVAKAIESDGRKKVGIIGTKLVTMSSTYQTHLGLKGIQVIAPEPHEAELLDEIIFGELIYGTARPESRAAIYGVMDRLIQRGCEGVIVACSEVPLVVSQESAPTKLYDAADLLAEGAVRYAAGHT